MNKRIFRIFFIGLYISEFFAQTLTPGSGSRNFVPDSGTDSKVIPAQKKFNYQKFK